MKRLSLLLSTLIPLTAGVILDDFTQGGGVQTPTCGSVAGGLSWSENGNTIMGGSGVRNFTLYGTSCVDPPTAPMTIEVNNGYTVTLGAGRSADLYVHSVGQPYTITDEDHYLVYEVAEAVGVTAAMYVGLNRSGTAGRPIPAGQYITGPGRYYFDLTGGPRPVLPGTTFDSYELILLPIGPLTGGTQDVRLTISRLEIVGVPEPSLAAPVAVALAAILRRRLRAGGNDVLDTRNLSR